jgi:hypothetical protein
MKCYNRISQEAEGDAKLPANQRCRRAFNLRVSSLLICSQFPKLQALGHYDHHTDGLSWYRFLHLPCFRTGERGEMIKRR